MNKMVIFHFMHKNCPGVSIKGLVDGDYLFDEEARIYGEGIIQYYQGNDLRWEFPVNPFMRESKKWKAYEELKDIISKNEDDFARKVFDGEKTLTSTHFKDMVIIREVLTW